MCPVSGALSVPGSGKSTVAKILAERLKERGKVKLLVSDEIRGKRYERIYSWIGENLNKADSLIVDATFYKKEWRGKVKEIANSQNVFICYLYCLLKTCLKRNQQRKPSFPDRVIHIINAEMEKPEKPDISINTNKIKPEKAVVQILNKLTKQRGILRESRKMARKC